SDVQAQKAEPDYLEAEENGACPQADEKQTPRRLIPYFQAERECSLRNERHSATVTYCGEQGYCCGYAASQTRSESGPPESERLDKPGFAKESAGHGP